MKSVFIVIGGILAAVALSFGFAAWGLGLKSFTAPASVAIDRKTFQQSQMYNEGMATDLDDLRLQYSKAETPEQKDMIKSVVRHRFSNYPADRLPADSANFLIQMRSN